MWQEEEGDEACRLEEESSADADIVKEQGGRTAKCGAGKYWDGPDGLKGETSSTGELRR